MENNLKSRLTQFISAKGMSIRRFELECGLPNAYVSNLRNNITSRRLDAITAKFPDLNLQWLMTGEGSMSRGESAANSDNVEKRLDEVSVQMLRMITEFIRQENKITERYRESIDRLQEQNARLTEMIEKLLADRQSEKEEPHKNTVIG